jgi:hypothetical protein
MKQKTGKCGHTFLNVQHQSNYPEILSHRDIFVQR